MNVPPPSLGCLRDIDDTFLWNTNHLQYHMGHNSEQQTQDCKYWQIIEVYIFRMIKLQVGGNYTATLFQGI